MLHKYCSIKRATDTHVIKLPKRYLVDPALVATALRQDMTAIPRDSDLPGCILDTFVTARLCAELDVSSTSACTLWGGGK